MEGSCDGGDQLRVISINVCCLASGLRNKTLTKLSFSCGILLWLASWAALTAFLQRNTSTGITILGSLVSSVLAFFPAHVVAVPLSRLVGGAILYATGKHDFKEARLKGLAQLLPDYDVLAVQELYSTTPSWLDAGFADYLVTCAAAQGFHYIARCEGPQLPSVCMDAGLMILSRYPITQQQSLVFRSQFIGDRFAVNRGALYACISLPSHKLGPHTSHCHFFTCHVCPSMGNFTDSVDIAKVTNTTRTNQFSQLGEFVVSRGRRGAQDTASTTTPLKSGAGEEQVVEDCSCTVVAGDFNSDIRFTKAGAPIPGLALQQASEAMAQAGLRDCSEGSWTPTFGYFGGTEGRESLLTRSDAQLLADDLVFASPSYKAECRATPLRIQAPWWLQQEEGLTHISDHWGLACKLWPDEGSR